jgi:hypothetical protein
MTRPWGTTAVGRIAVVVAILVLGAGCTTGQPSHPTSASRASVEGSGSSLVVPTAASSPTALPAGPSSSLPGPSALPPTIPPPVLPPASVGPAIAAIPIVHETAVGHVPDSVDDRGWEPVVATHPTDPDRIAVVYQHRGPGAACRLNPVIRISRDGGKSWRSTRRSPAAHSGRGLSLHAAIAWGPGPTGGSRLYWTNMTTPGCGDPRFSLSTAYSDDDGDTWSNVRVERRTPPWVGGFPEIAVDRDPRSPDYGTVYVGYNWLPRGGRGPGFRLLTSVDFGRTWLSTEIAPVPGPPGFGDWWRIGYRLRPAPGGGVYASWYQADLRRWDRTAILSKGGPRNVGRLGVAVAFVALDAATKTLHVGPSRMAATVRETAFTTGGGSAPGTAGNIRPDPMWLHGFDVDPASGRLYLAVAGYGPATGDSPRGTIRVGRSDDGGRSWTFSRLPAAPSVGGHRQSSIKPNLVAGPGYLLVTFHTLDDVRAGATVGNAFAISTDDGVTWRPARPISPERWRAANLGGVVNGIGLRERAERLADGAVFWAYGDGRRASATASGRVAIYGARIDVTADH